MTETFKEYMIRCWSIQKVRAWSNKGKTGTGLDVDDTVIDDIEDQVDAEFEVEGRTTMDLSNKVHRLIARQRGGYLLKRYGGESSATEAEGNRTLQLYTKLREIDHNDLVDPESFLVMDMPADKEYSSIVSNEMQRNVLGVSKRSNPSGSLFTDDEDDF